MTQKVSHGSQSRRPVFSGNRRVSGLYERRLADGTVVYDTRVRRGGKQERIVLDAKNKTAAIEELRALRVDDRRGDPVRTSSLIPTVSEVADEWLAALELRTKHRDPAMRRSPRTLALYRDRTKSKVLPTLGRIAIDEVTVADLRRLVEKLGAKHAPSTVTQVISMLSSLMRFALRAGYVSHNVVRDLDRDDRPGVARQSEPRYLSSDEIVLVLSKMSDTFRPVASTCAYAGLRISEALGLTWSDIDFDAKSINVAKQLDPDGTIRNATKTKSSTALVPLLPALERELRAHRSRQAEIDLRLVRASSLVFTTARGKPQSRRNALRALHNAGEAVGLHGENLEPVGLHDLRHSLVANALDSNVTLAEAAVLARHANAKVTSQIYAGVSETAKAQIATKLTAAGFGS
jgi:integrase